MTIVETRKHGDASDGMIGGRHTRLEGDVKVKGAATYALEYPVENVAHAVLVQSTVAAGRVVTVDTVRANAAPGVLLILTPEDELGLTVASAGTATARTIKPTGRCLGKFASMARASAPSWRRRASRQSKLPS